MTFFKKYMYPDTTGGTYEKNSILGSAFLRS